MFMYWISKAKIPKSVTIYLVIRKPVFYIRLNYMVCFNILLLTDFAVHSPISWCVYEKP
jgi:hypothetical protein